MPRAPCSGVFSTLQATANHDSAIVHVSPRTCIINPKSTGKTCISISIRQLVRRQYDDIGLWRRPIPAELGLVLAVGSLISSSQRARISHEGSQVPLTDPSSSTG